MPDNPSIARPDDTPTPPPAVPSPDAAAGRRRGVEDQPDPEGWANHLYAGLAEAAGEPWRSLERCWQSRIDPERCYGLQGELFYKSAPVAPSGTAPRRRQDLRGEAGILARCRGIPGIPEVVERAGGGAGRVLVTRRLRARPLSQLDLGWGQLLWLTVRLALTALRLARRGVSHDDFRAENVMVDRAGGVHLVDFDQASRGSFVVCLARSVLSLSFGRTAVSNGITAPLRARLQATLPPAVIRRLRRRDHRPRPGAGLLPLLSVAASPEFAAMHAAWRIAATADASAPGRALAYYQIDRGGVRWPGERPWAERWQALQAITDFRNRRILELGCNLGLLSIFLLEQAGSSAALAVDRNRMILEAGASAARAFHVRPEFRQIDFDGAADWEVELLAFRPDVVFALKIGHWVRDQARFLTFLGGFDELIYEGHDSTRTERRRLAAAGFTTIELVHTSERGRPVLHCRKAPVARAAPPGRHAR